MKSSPDSGKESAVAENDFGFAARLLGSRHFTAPKGRDSIAQGGAPTDRLVALGSRTEKVKLAPTGRDSCLRATRIQSSNLAPLGLSICWSPLPRARALGYRISPPWGWLAASQSRIRINFDDSSARTSGGTVGALILLQSSPGPGGDP